MEEQLVRVERWKRRLLDLSLRNRLLNCRDGRLLLPLKCDDVAKLEDRLAADAAVAVESSLTPAETLRRLKEIHRSGRTALEETGVNSVFVAVGFLEWKEREGAETVRRAPILLVPTILERTSATAGYRMVRHDEDAHLNTTLVEFLRVEHGIQVSGMEPLPMDDAGVDVTAVLAAFEKSVAAKGWRVAREAALGFFTFGKVVLWKDLTSRLEIMRRHPLVEHLITSGGTYDDGIEVFPPEEVAEHLDPTELFCPLSADSSQLAAVLYSAMNKTFVLHGPPGTGKSQTITNLIVHNLALGRRVLFVSEKKAALDVVHRRLEACGVGPFCLELHSNKTGKAHVLAQITEAFEVPPVGAPSGMPEVCRQVSNADSELAEYARALHRQWPNGYSAYDVLVRVGQRHPRATETLIGVTCTKQTREEADRLRCQAMELSAEWSGVDAAAFHDLAPVKGSEWSPQVEQTLAAALDEMIAAFAAEEQGGIFAKLKRWWLARSHSKRIVRLPPPAAKAKAVLERAKAALGASRIVFAYRARHEKAVMAGIGKFALALEKGEFGVAEAERVFDGAYAAKMLSEILSAERQLANFAGLTQEETIRKFRQADKLLVEAVKKNVFARLAARLPAGRGADCPDKSELGLLKRECAKKTRQKPVRQLLAEAKGVIGKLKPCFLMSPLSVSQYLPPDSSPFDLVVFDEASQIPVQDAVGVIARARQLVVVGDPKQMPPTNFFQKGEGGAEEDEDVEGVEDMESILDEALALNVHSAYLNWHYRSRHESLIAFSNAHYYDDRLNTFPAARNAAELGMSLHWVEGGVYEARGRRVNVKEAEAVVESVFAEAARLKPRSVGVVTFSIAQKELIEDMIEKRLADEPAAEAFFDESREDPFFVKNLENVQGDERDVVFFSVCYAPDANGDFAMNFGPLNREGGERRLNVAVTRAKEQVVVFASIHGSQIDLSRTSAKGAAHLREFLEYAERGGEVRDGGNDEIELPIAEVAAFLAEKGYGTVAGVGTSSRKVDLAVIRPGTENEYLLGILGDGPGYAADRTVRDREASRVEVLQGLGWNLFRLWSVDWALDRGRTQRRLLEAIAHLENDPGARLPPKVVVPNEELKRVLRPLPAAGRAAAIPKERKDVTEVEPSRLRAMRDAVVRDYGKCPNEVIYREIARRLGYHALSPKAKAHLEAVLG